MLRSLNQSLVIEMYDTNELVLPHNEVQHQRILKVESEQDQILHFEMFGCDRVNVSLPAWGLCWWASRPFWPCPYCSVCGLLVFSGRENWQSTESRELASLSAWHGMMSHITSHTTTFHLQGSASGVQIHQIHLRRPTVAVLLWESGLNPDQPPVTAEVPSSKATASRSAAWRTEGGQVWGKKPFSGLNVFFNQNTSRHVELVWI